MLNISRGEKKKKVFTDNLVIMINTDAFFLTSCKLSCTFINRINFFGLLELKFIIFS